MVTDKGVEIRLCESHARLEGGMLRFRVILPLLILALAVPAGLVAASITLPFPSAGSTLGCGYERPLGAGGGASCYVAGERVWETFTGTGLSSTVSAQWDFDMSNYTDPGTTNTFDVLINGIVIGNYQFTSVLYGVDLSFDLPFSFPAIAGDAYTLEIVATSTVPAGAGSYNWYPGGTVTLSDAGGAVVPEPATFGLLFTALAAIAVARRRR
jgi:hypothetical protein